MERPFALHVSVDLKALQAASDGKQPWVNLDPLGVVWHAHWNPVRETGPIRARGAVPRAPAASEQNQNAQHAARLCKVLMHECKFVYTWPLG